MERKTWTTPRLETHGNISDLTRGDNLTSIEDNPLGGLGGPQAS